MTLLVKNSRSVKQSFSYEDYIFDRAIRVTKLGSIPVLN